MAECLPRRYDMVLIEIVKHQQNWLMDEETIGFIRKDNDVYVL